MLAHIKKIIMFEVSVCHLIKIDYNGHYFTLI
jgi:hypothetical protein